MKFRSKNKKTIRLSSTHGHVVRVGPEWVEVPDCLVRDAYANGCISEEMFKSIRDEMSLPDGSGSEEGGVAKVTSENADPESPEAKHAKKVEIVKAAIMKMVESPEPSYFTAEGFPNLKVLSGKCEFTVPKQLMKEAWEIVQEELDGKEEKQ